MPQTQFLVYKTDEWHTHTSKTLLGLFTSRSRCLTCIRGYIKKEMIARLDDEDVEELTRNNQTSSRENNFMIDPIEVNENLY